MKNKGAILLIGSKDKEKEILAKRLEKKGYEKVTVAYALKKRSIPVFQKIIVPDDIVVDVIKQEVVLSARPCAICNFPINVRQAKMLLNSGVRIDRIIILDRVENINEIMKVFERSGIKHIFLNSNVMYYDLEEILSF